MVMEEKEELKHFPLDPISCLINYPNYLFLFLSFFFQLQSYSSLYNFPFSKLKQFIKLKHKTNLFSTQFMFTFLFYFFLQNCLGSVTKNYSWVEIKTPSWEDRETISIYDVIKWAKKGSRRKRRRRIIINDLNTIRSSSSAITTSSIESLRVSETPWLEYFWSILEESQTPGTFTSVQL